MRGSDSLQNLRQHAASQSASGYFPRPEEGELPPFPTAAQLLDHSHLKPGERVKLLNYDTTLEQYRANAKKTNDPDLMFEFACFVMEVVRELDPNKQREKQKRDALILESTSLLGRIASRGHVAAQYLLADLYSQGIGTAKGKRDYDKAFPLFMLAAKHGHADGCFRAGQCCENGWGCRKEFGKAIQFYRKAAAMSHPSAMYRLGLAELNGELGLSKKPKEGVKWLKRAAEYADSVDPPVPQPLHELALIHERGIDNVVFIDLEYAAELLARSAELNWAPSAYKLGECYEYGKMGCPQDPALSIHYYNIAAQQDHPEACFALTAWYLVGSPGVLPQSDTEAYLWARKAAEKGLPKAEYAVGYFFEVGIGTPKDGREALSWFRKAATHGDKRAINRLKSQYASAADRYAPEAGVDREKMTKEALKKGKKGKDDSDCVIA
ncbi:HCP-like protein [Atractiella rhizophila]|nr:HCP-like protein [Atractiella rhizophila]